MSTLRRDAEHRRQPTFFDDAPNPPVRSSDPVTSHIGAEHAVRIGGRSQQVFLDVLAAAVGPLTAQEVAEIAAKTRGVMAETIRKRAKELQAAGKIVNAGEKRCSVTGHLATMYSVK